MPSLRNFASRAVRRARLVHRWRRGPRRDLSSLRVADIGRVALSIDPALYADGRLYEPAPYELRPLPMRESPRVIHPAYRYSLPAPRLLGERAFCAQLGDWYRQVEEKFVPGGVAVVESVIDDAVLFGNAVFRAEGETLYGVYESCRDDDRAIVTAPSRRDLRWTQRIDDDVDHVFLGSPGSGNYGHFLTDDATRLTPPPPHRETVYLMSDHGGLMNDRRSQLLALALGDAAHRVRFIDPERPVQVRRLRYASRPSHHPFLKCPAALADLRAAVLGAAPAAGSADRLYLVRRTPEGRRLGNHEEIEAALRARGFAVLDPMEASARDQATACAGASVIVGIMGAAMTNSLFAAPGTDVIHLAPAGWQEPYYWDLAGVCDHRYTAIYGTAEGDGAAWTSAFHISVGELTAALDGTQPPR